MARVFRTLKPYNARPHPPVWFRGRKRSFKAVQVLYTLVDTDYSSTASKSYTYHFLTDYTRTFSLKRPALRVASLAPVRILSDVRVLSEGSEFLLLLLSYSSLANTELSTRQ